MAGRRRANFWTHRRVAVREAESATPADNANTASAEAAVPPGSALDKTDAQIFRALDLPDPDTLQEDTDFTPFLRGAVPRFARPARWPTIPSARNGVSRKAPVCNAAFARHSAQKARLPWHRG